MSIGEKDPPGSETIHVGGKRLRMPIEAPDPVVQVIYRNKKNVWALSTRSARKNQGKEEENKRMHGEELSGLNVSPPCNQTHVSILALGTHWN